MNKAETVNLPNIGAGNLL